MGGQYSHLIVRRCRELGVYTELLPYDIPIEELRRGIEAEEGAGKIKGIILSGSPFSVHEPNSPKCSSEIVDLNIPILGICYGAQLIAYVNGGVVGEGRKSEFGRTELLFDDSDLFEGLTENESESGRINVWMSHGDVIERLASADIIGYTMNSPVAAFRISNIYGVQFHPEVHHTEKGEKILWNFLYTICGCERNWTIESFVRDKIKEIKSAVGSDGRVICGLSSGIDSSTTALLINKAIGDRLTCIFVDNGLLREGEKEAVINTFKNNFEMRMVFVDAKERLLERLRGVKDAEAKRMVIGELFINIFEEEARKLGNVDFLAQDTIYPDRIESPGASSRNASRIKSHHNVGALPEKLGLKLIELIKDLYKDEAREVAKELGMPSQIRNQHPFPGPGLAARVIGEVTEDKLRICREASHIVEEELKRSGWYNKVWRAFAVVGDDVATGVLGDARGLARIVTIRVVESREAMTADFVKLPYEVLESMSKRITNEVKGVTWVTYAISSKPPATIEPC
uniref:GMP synthase [glutamine-hydrolyzing] n=1 Tax=Candidatus Methanophagaceae archaeon ANME-1 ERB6 TaxID=2759912 RepID=A0A7G9YUM3_9EURY|nr:NH(3)-dependent NAD(+) synthetase [Methanosarcinales archaeon ANME-1 ERB6]